MKTNAVIMGLIFLLACTTQAPTGNVVAEDAQIVNVGVSGSSYTFDTERVSAGKPVRLVFDADQLPGCSRAVTVPAYKAHKLITHEDNTIEFTPLASGPVLVSCSMAMYTGELMVE